VWALLASGANIVTTRGEFHHPASMDPDVRAAVENACRAGGTSIHSTGSSPGFISEALPIALASIQRRLDSLAAARETIRIAAGTLEAGTVAAQKMIVTGVRDGRPLLRFAATWYRSDVLDRDWDQRATGWHVVVDGDAPLAIGIRFAVPIERMGDASSGYTANRAANAVRYVCAGPAGIQPTAALPQIIVNLG